MELTWFRRPGPETPGTLNLCYNALDVHVVRGDLERVTLLEQVAALAGVLQGLGVAEGTYVAESLDEEPERVLLLLALLRIGAVLIIGEAEGPAGGIEPKLTIEPGQIEPAVKVGRQDPAGCVDLAPGTAALLVDGASVSQLEVLDRTDWAGRLIAGLCAGGSTTVGPITIGRA
ncbi:hypothetical protein [Nocardioides cavernaquae]|uniref:hypothetical protein n=1 Tax=Nocardioides cavernaquae TaxID=2321396 RepID=UPI001602527A|nr:hypothetical protein [Nocardioides cavernaquae]